MKAILSLLFIAGCALAVPKGSRIVGGQNAIPHEFPYIISFQRINGVKNDHFCGGSILSDQWILTAAHCVYSEIEWINGTIIVAGAHNIATRNANEQRRKAKQVIIHKDYDTELSPYDIALVQVNQSFALNNYVKSIELPKGEPYYPQGEATVMGWGSISNTTQMKYPDILQKTVLPILPAARCSSHFPGSSSVGLANICAGDLDGSAVCRGDSGGPFVQKTSRGDDSQIGVVSSGTYPCGAKNGTASFVNVSFFLKWITDNTGIST